MPLPIPNDIDLNEPAPLRAFCKSAVDDVRAADRSIIFRISDATPDRDREIVLPAGADLREFRKNPVVDWMHRMDPTRGAVPIAKAAKPGWIRFDKSMDSLVSKAIFFDDDFSDRIFRMYQEDFLRAVSIEADPYNIEIREPTSEELKAHPKWRGYMIWAQWQLRAYSAVPIPANPNALRLAAAKGYLDGGVAESFGVTVDEFKTETPTPEPPRRRALIRAPQVSGEIKRRRRVIIPLEMEIRLPSPEDVINCIDDELRRLRGEV